MDDDTKATLGCGCAALLIGLIIVALRLVAIGGLLYLGLLVLDRAFGLGLGIPVLWGS